MTLSETLIKARPYQNDALVSTFMDLEEGFKRVAIVLPTGSGKTIIMSHIADTYLHPKNRSKRVLIIVDRDELAQQTIEKLHMVAPSLNVGLVKAERDEYYNRDVIVATIQTIRKRQRLDRFSQLIGLVLVDECDLAAADGYIQVLTDLGCFNEDSETKAVGFTATLSRTDKKSLGNVWQKVSYQRDYLDMINDGYLVDVKGKLITVNGLSLAEVAMSGGDFQIGSLSDALLSASAPQFVADAYKEHAADRPGIVFTPNVATAHAFAEYLNYVGIAAEPIWGTMPMDDRRRLIRTYQKGDIQVLTNCQTLTRGFDAPRAEVAVIARPTTSSTLYVQMIGRVLRPYAGKTDALVLDVVGASQEHRLASMVDLTSRRLTTMMPGESLMEAVKREKKERNVYLQDYSINWRDVNLFSDSQSIWLQTKLGIWFVVTGDSYLFIWPGKTPETYRVGRMPLKGPRKPDYHGWLHDEVSLDYARAWIETESGLTYQGMENSYSIARNSSWRRNPVSPAALNLAQGLGLKVHSGMKAGYVSDQINIHLVSLQLDKTLRKVKS